jgi:hypothetical protein
MSFDPTLRTARRKKGNYRIDTQLLFEIRDLLERFDIAAKIGPKELKLASEIQQLRTLAANNSRRLDEIVESLDPVYREAFDVEA